MATLDLNSSDFEVIGTAADEADAIVRPSVSFWRDALNRFLKNPIAVAGSAIIITLSLLAIFAPVFSPYEYNQIDYSGANRGFSAEHWFGTDNLGRDIWSRVWMGGRVSLSIGLLGAILPSLLGIVIGGVSGYFGGKVDMAIMRFIDIGLCIPNMIYLILIIIYIGSGPASIIIAFGMVAWMGMARMVRGMMLTLKEREFVMAARALGSSPYRIIFKHLVPNVLGFLILGIANLVPAVIFAEAYMSYLGLGISVPMTSWGQLCTESTSVLRTYPMRLFIPAFMISITMLASNLVGDGLRDALDPKLRDQ